MIHLFRGQFKTFGHLVENYRNCNNSLKSLINQLAF